MKQKKGLPGKLITILCNILLCLCILLTCYIMISSSRGRVANLFGKSILRVVSGSMEPTIYAGDYILVEKVDCDQLREGDIITFYSEDDSISGMPNTHRIVSINADGSFVTKGDANSTADETIVTPDRLIGKYSGKLRFFRWLSSFQSVRKLVMMGVIILLLIMSVYECNTILKISRLSDEEKKKRAELEKEKLIREAIDREKQRLYEAHYSEQEQEEKKE
ncbi:MAG: signal peptidase I [Ruminococcus sp.]